MSSSSVPPLHRNSNGDGDGDGVNEDNEFPPGYRFAPEDDELIEHYLLRKITNRPLSMDKIKEVDLYKHNPKELTDMHERFGENEWYFFTPRDRKYQNGNRPNRAADTGYWKATGADKKLFDKNNHKSVIGYKKALVFYQGKPPKGDKTNWIMHEYRVDHHGSSRVRLTSNNNMRLDDWVLCRIYEKKEKSKKTPSTPSNRASNKKPEEFVNECDASEMMYNHNVMYDSMGLINTNTCSNRKSKAKKVPTLKPNKKPEFVNECDASEMMMYNNNVMYDSMGLINTNTCSNCKSEAKKESTLEPNEKPVLTKKIGTFQMIHDHNCMDDLMRLINTNTRSNCALRPKKVPTLEPSTNSEFVNGFGVSETTCNHNGMYGSMELNNINDTYLDVGQSFQSFQPFPSGLDNTNTCHEFDQSLPPLAYNHQTLNHSMYINQSVDCMPNKEFRCYNEMKSAEPVFSRPYQPAMESNYMKNPQENNQPAMGSSFMEIPQENNISGDMGGSKQYNFDTQQAKFISSQYDSNAMDLINEYLNPKP